jgi:hypothetical protein
MYRKTVLHHASERVFSGASGKHSTLRKTLHLTHSQPPLDPGWTPAGSWKPVRHPPKRKGRASPSAHSPHHDAFIARICCRCRKQKCCNTLRSRSIEPCRDLGQRQLPASPCGRAVAAQLTADLLPGATCRPGPTAGLVLTGAAAATSIDRSKAATQVSLSGEANGQARACASSGWTACCLAGSKGRLTPHSLTGWRIVWPPAPIQCS